MQSAQIEVNAVPLEEYQEDLVYIRRKQVVCPHDALVVNLQEKVIICKDCEKKWE